MGSVRNISNKRTIVDIPKNLVLSLKDKYNVKNFIETGTYQGQTSLWASNHFEKVLTIEASKKMYDTCLKIFQNNKKDNVYLYHGTSNEILSKDNLEIDYKHHSTIFWLDSYWTGQGSFGDHLIHPLLEEIRLITQSTSEHFIFIDDLSLFSHLCKFDCIDEWPLIGDIFWQFTTSLVRYNFCILGDCLFAFPDKRDVKILLNSFREDIYMNYL